MITIMLLMELLLIVLILLAKILGVTFDYVVSGCNKGLNISVSLDLERNFGCLR
jgi:hypothetical protein